MENVVVSIFDIESEAFQAFSELKQFGQTENKISSGFNCKS